MSQSIASSTTSTEHLNILYLRNQSITSSATSTEHLNILYLRNQSITSSTTSTGHLEILYLRNQSITSSTTSTGHLEIHCCRKRSSTHPIHSRLKGAHLPSPCPRTSPSQNPNNRQNRTHDKPPPQKTEKPLGMHIATTVKACVAIT